MVGRDPAVPHLSSSCHVAVSATRATWQSRISAQLPCAGMSDGGLIVLANPLVNIHVLERLAGELLNL